MFCPSCGAENPDGTRFCIRCGDPMINMNNNQKVNISKDAGPQDNNQSQQGVYQNNNQFQQGAYQNNNQFQQGAYQNNNQFQQGAYQNNNQYYMAPNGMNGASSNIKLFSVLAYIPLLFIIGLVSDPEKRDPFVRGHVNNGIIITIACAVISLIGAVPFLGIFVAAIAYIPVLVFIILGIVNASQGQRYTLPFCDNIKFIN